MRLPVISRMLQIYKKDSFPMTKRHRNMGIYSFCYSQSLDILHTYVGL